MRRQRRHVAWAIGLAFAVVAVLPAAAGAASTRDVVVVSNNWDGTADVVDATSFKRLKRLNIVPDSDQRIAEIKTDPTETFYFNGIRTLIGEGHDQLVDDAFVSRDGRELFVSRPSFKDVIAMDIATGNIRWRVRVDGYRSDHMALSPDGRRILVSASTARLVDVIDTRRGRIIGRIPAGETPHENNFSRDGSLIFQASIGLTYTEADDPSQDATKGDRVFEVIDAKTLKVKRRVDVGKLLARWGVNVSAGVRPMAISPDERYVYMQLSFLHGFVEYDLKNNRPLRIAFLPISAGAAKLRRQDYLLDSAHHGLAFDKAGSKLCVAATMSDYATVVDRRTLRPGPLVGVGAKPYWATASRDGRYCFVSVSGNDRVSVISYATGREVARIAVGDHPQRMRTGAVREDAVARG